MRPFWTLLKKDLLMSFRMPSFYLLAAIYSFLLGIFFYQSLAQQQTTSWPLTISVIRPLFGNQNFLFFLLTPLLSMGSFSYEKMSGTFTLLLNSPITHPQIIGAKYLQLLIKSIFILLLSAIFPIMLLLSGYQDWVFIGIGYLGLLLNIMLFQALGLFLSTLGQSQAMVALMSYALLFLLFTLHHSASFATNFHTGKMISYLGLMTHFEGFTRGVIHSYSVVYYITGIFLFLFLTKKSLEIQED